MVRLGALAWSLPSVEHKTLKLTIGVQKAFAFDFIAEFFQKSKKLSGNACVWYVVIAMSDGTFPKFFGHS